MTDKSQLIYGRHPVLEALKAGQAFEKLFIQRDVKSPEISEIRREAQAREFPVQFVPSQKLNSITKKVHQGVIGFLSLVRYYNVEDVLMKTYDEGKVPLFLMLDGVTDVRNFGAIARTAELMGVHAIIVPARGGALINAEAIKSSAGALNLIHVCKVKQLSDAAKMLKLNGIRLFAADEKRGTKIFESDLTVPLAIIFGAEGEGISPDLLRLADENICVPMSGKIGSFNVSVAAGIILYETARQRFFDSER